MATILSSSTLEGDQVTNAQGEDLGKLEEVMIDVEGGRVAYAVLSFGAGFLQSGKFFAIPWESLAVDQTNKQLILDVPREVLESAEGFDKDHWPNMADQAFRDTTYSHYGIKH